MKKVLIPIPVFSAQCPEELQYLKDHGLEVIQNQYGLPFSFDRYADVMSEIEGVIAGVEVWNKERMAACPNLKIIARFGIGVDNFDLEAAKERGIICTNAPGYNTNAVAEHALGLILNITRRISRFDRDLRDGCWVKHPGIELRGRTLGLVGCGAIARRLAGFAQAFGMKVIAYDAYPNEELAKKANITLMPFEQMLQQAEIVSVHVPGNAETRHMMNKQTFAMMREGAYFINTSRGIVTDEAALYEALKSGHLTAAAADVFEQEPLPLTSPLLELPNFVATPHTAAITKEANKDIARCCVKAVVDCLEGRSVEHVLNP